MVTIDLKSEPTNPSISQTADGLPPAYSPPEIPSQASVKAPSDLPPSFSAGPSTSTSTGVESRLPRPPLSVPTNYLTIDRENQSVKGTYSIDATLPVPPGVTPSIDTDGKQLHLRLKSQNGSVNCVVDVIRGMCAKGPARLDAQSVNGSLTLTIVSIFILDFYSVLIDHLYSMINNRLTSDYAQLQTTAL